MNIHVINHTHWDREWFLSSVYTTHWIPGLIDRLTEIAADNPDFRYFFDGQTLVIEDLLKAYPEYRPKVEKLVRDGNLTIGPYYCQPDWKLTAGELLIRNIEYGQKDAAALGQEPSASNVGWLVDTFGHISQSPQIHRLCGIDAVYVWRGMPEMVPYFEWRGASGDAVLGVNLFGGYRNLYGVTHVPEVAERRLVAEVEKLSPYYPTADLPLFDGYDLEDNPEDPVRFFEGIFDRRGAEGTEEGNSSREGAKAQRYEILESTPSGFVDVMREKLGEIPTIEGELNSGKFGATFPGTLSARTYLKVMAWDCVTALTRVCEPLAVMAWAKGRPYEAEKYEAWSRLLLQNAVHDCICGVSIDLVHEKMEDVYRQVMYGIRDDIRDSLQFVMGDFAEGAYYVCTEPMEGMGVYPRLTTYDYKELDYNKDVVVEDNGIVVDGVHVGLRVTADHGDTYSDEVGEVLGWMRPVIGRTREGDASLEFRYERDGIDVIAYVVLGQGNGVLRWSVRLNVRSGVDFQIDFVVRGEGLTQRRESAKVWAGMPFDVVERRVVDEDLLGRDVDGALEKILLGQREVNRVKTFPFHDFVAVEGDKTVAVLAKGLHSYCVEDGAIAITLCRSVEWLTKPNLENRVGDAGPFFYVPDARCERSVSHQLGIVVGDFAADSLELQRINAKFQYPSLWVWVHEKSEGDQKGVRNEWAFLSSDVPMSSLQVVDGEVVGRFYNPTSENSAFVAPKRIAMVRPTMEAIEQTNKLTDDKIHFFWFPARIRGWRRQRLIQGKRQREQGSNREIIEQLHEKTVQSRQELEKIQQEIDALNDGSPEKYRAQHRYYVLEREMLEYMLSATLNQLKVDHVESLAVVEIERERDLVSHEHVSREAQYRYVLRKLQSELPMTETIEADIRLVSDALDPVYREAYRPSWGKVSSLYSHYSDSIDDPDEKARVAMERKQKANLRDQARDIEDKMTNRYLYEADSQVAEIGWQLNQLRIKRRIFDYVVAALD